MWDRHGGGQRVEPAAGAVIGAARQTREEAGGEKIAGAGRIDNALDRKGLYRFGPRRADYQAAFFAPRHHGGADVSAQRLDRGVEVGRLIEAVQLPLVGE